METSCGRGPGGDGEALRLALTQLGCDVVPGQANYLLFFHRNSSLDQDLAQRGIFDPKL